MILSLVCRQASLLIFNFSLLDRHEWLMVIPVMEIKRMFV